MKILIKVAAVMAIFANVAVSAMNQTPVSCGYGYRVSCSATGCGCVKSNSAGASWSGGGVGPVLPRNNQTSGGDGVGPECLNNDCSNL